jgi:hypothetical protein
MSILTNNVMTGLASPLNESPATDMEQHRSKISVSPWALMMLTCILLGISGGVRFWRDLQFKTLAQESTTSPFPLKELPKSIGSWHAVEGSDRELDPEIARLAGSSDHINRVYENKETGEQVSALVIYGLAGSVFGHIPEICYPSAGYEQSVASAEHQFSLPGSTTLVQYRSACFTKSIGAIGRSQQEEVFYTFLHNGEWLPDPAIFKIQLQRHASRGAIHDSPSESLMKELVQEIDRRVSQTKTQVATVATPAR